MTTTQSVQVDNLRLCPLDQNPNVMSDAEQAALTTAIREHGFVQAITVAETPDGLEVIDGNHRVLSAKELGITAVPAHVLVGLTPEDIIVRRIAMNKNRGHLDLGIVRVELARAMELAVEPIDLTLTGYSDAELSALLTPSDEMFGGAKGTGGSETDEEAEKGAAKPHVVELQFKDAKTAKTVRARLRKASGAAKDMGVGVLALLDLLPK